MKIKRNAEDLAFYSGDTRPDLRSSAAKRMSRPSKLAIIERGRNKVSAFYAARGLSVF